MREILELAIGQLYTGFKVNAGECKSGLTMTSEAFRELLGAGRCARLRAS